MRHTLLVTAVVAGLASSLDAQERPSIAEGVELRVMDAPTVTVIDGRRVLAWELHVFNNREDPVTLRRVSVAANGGTELASFSDPPLLDMQQSIQRTRLASILKHSVPPGSRRVLHLWMPVPDTAKVPRELLNTVTFSDVTEEHVVHMPAVRVSRDAPINIAPPVRGGPWVAIYDPELVGGHRAAIYTVDGVPRIPGRFAIDFVKLPEAGVFDARSEAPDRNGFATDVLAVGAGTVVAAVDDMPDNLDSSVGLPRFPIQSGSGNYVAIDLGHGRVAFYEHLQSKSIAVRTGQRVRRGDVIAKLGYSGSSTIGPHLHFHIADANSLLGAEGRPFTFDAFHELGAFGSISTFIGGKAYDTRGSARIERRREMPRPNAVVMFP